MAAGFRPVVTMVAATDPWRWQAHPEVWFLVVAVVALGWWATRVIGPRVVPVGEPIITPFQRRAFVLATLLLLVSADWPLHDIAEAHLYAVHMLQHMIITFIVPPLFLLAIPPWLARLLVLELVLELLNSGQQRLNVLRLLRHFFSQCIC